MDRIKVAKELIKIAKLILSEVPNVNMSTDLDYWLLKNPNPSDEEFHEFSEKSDYNTHQLEGYAYESATRYACFALGGRAIEKGITEKDVSPEELNIGIEVEYEHLIPKKIRDKNSVIAGLCKKISKRIALDHLAEFASEGIKSDYYTRLKKMEENMSRELGEYKGEQGE